MTHIASVLTVATVSIGLWTLIATRTFNSQRKEGAYIYTRQKYLCRNRDYTLSFFLKDYTMYVQSLVGTVACQEIACLHSIH